MQNLIMLAAPGSKRLRALRVLQMEHLLFQQAERNAYYARRHDAVTKPEEYTSLNCDGMTQIICNIPRKYKFEYSARTLNQKLVGVLVHRDV